MNQAQTIAAIAKRAVLSEDEVLRVYRAMAYITREQLRKGDKVKTSLFTISAVERKAMHYRNPQTGQQVNLPNRAAMKIRLNGEWGEMRKGNFDWDA